MNYDREEYMRRQDADHAMIAMRTPLPPRRAHRPATVSVSAVCRRIEQQEIAPCIKQRLYLEIAELASAMSTGTAKTPEAAEGRSPASATGAAGDAQPLPEQSA
jgi:hypothetical protein